MYIPRVFVVRVVFSKYVENSTIDHFPFQLEKHVRVR